MHNVAVADQQADWIEVLLKITTVYSGQSTAGFNEFSQASNLSVRVGEYLQPHVRRCEIDQIHFSQSGTV